MGCAYSERKMFHVVNVMVYSTNVLYFWIDLEPVASLVAFVLLLFLYKKNQ